MQVVGYVRELPGDANPAFSQSEAIRRWAAREGHSVVAVFQDSPGERSGYQALLAVLETRDIDALVVPELSVLSADLITQEVMIWHARSHGKAVASTTTNDAALLANESSDQTRNLVRHVLAKRDSHDVLTATSRPDRGREGPVPEEFEDSVLVEIVARAQARAS